MTARKPLRADAQRNREALLAKARELFATGDFFDLRFDDFARLAGVGTGTLYRHFPTREALAEAVYHEEVAALCDRARELRETLPAEDALATFLRGMVDYLDVHQGLARTLVTHPRLVFMDEPTGGLDVSVQARLLDLVRGLVGRLGLAVVLVTHDIAVARLLAGRIMVMQRGRVVETGLTDQVLDDPRHEYTQLLVSSVLQA